MRKLFTYTLCWLMGASYSYSQVKNNYVYNTSMPYGTLDIRTRISSSDYYYLEENKTFSFRESSPGVRTNTYLDMTGWDSSPYDEGHLRRKTGTTDYFVMNYRLLKPQNYNSSYAQGYPMIVHLHGAHERANCLYDNCYHSDWDYTVRENSPPAPTSATHKLLNNDHNLNVGGKHYLDARNLAGTRLPDDPSMPDRAFPGFVVVPQMMNSWDSLQVEDVVRIVRLLSEQYNIDQDRIYVQGISIGGYGVFEAMKRASWLFAAALPMAGVWDANILTQNQQDKVAHMPTWIFQGGLDPRPTPAYTENIIAGLEKAGAVVRYSLYSDLNHVVWYRAYGQTDYYTWMLSKRKSDLHPFSGNTVIDWAKSRYPKLMLAEGFLAYQWEKDGTILSHTDNTLTVTSPGKYRARFSRKSTSPSEAQWNSWSQVVTITETGTPAPTVSVSITNPEDGQSFTAPASISFAASASVTSGSIARVEFYNGNTKLGQDASSPYTFTWANVPAGSYSLSAKAIDNSGNSAEDGVNITITDLATVKLTSPEEGQSYTAPASISFAATATGDVAKVEFYNGNTKIGQDESSPYTFTWANVPAGNYSVSAKVIDNAGNSAMDEVNIIVSDDLPTVTLTSPEEGQSFTAPATISFAVTATGDVARVEFYNGSTRIGQDESSPYTFTWANVPAGNYSVSAKVIDNSGNSATDEVNIIVSDDFPTVTLTSPEEGQSFNAPATISFAATATGDVARVEFYNGSTRIGQDESSPYTFTWANVPAGNYSVSAKVIDNTGNFETDMVGITVNEDSGGSGELCASTGSIQAETWTGISGKDISSIPLSSSPSSITTLNMFETPSNIGDNYGTRVRGYICPPITGNYTFWIATNDNGELWLSTNDSPANKTRIAYVSGWTNPRQWDKYSTQQSAAVRLEAGTRYYIEGLLKEGSGTDNLAVGWQLPGGALERPIPGSRLIPFEGSSTNNPPTVNITSPGDGQSFTAPASISITATASDADGSIARVEFYNGTTKLGQDASSPYTFTWSSVSAGNYSLIAKAIDNSGNAATDEVDITVNEDSGGSGEPCASTGSIQAETWTGISGKDISSIPLSSSPSSITTLSLFETPSNIGDSYGTRVRGFICPPVTGNYTFWIATNDNGELWLSTNDSPANKTRIAYVSGWTNPRQWDKYSTQQSAAVRLEAGRRYYIEGLLKEGSGTDHMAVGWQLPGGALERPIPGSRLIPFEGSSTNNPPTVNITSPGDGQSFTAPASISFTATASDADGSIARVEFYNGATKLGQDASSPYTFTWSNVSAGNYSLIAKAIDNSGNAATDRVDITVNDDSGGSGEPCASTGSIQAETWTGISGKDISSIPLSSSPSSITTLSLFETPSNIGDSYGTRVRGYICPPVTGDYTFWIATNDNGELWLSTNDSPTNKTRIAYVSGWTNPRQWDKYSSQQSAAVRLEAGTRYYIEALLKEGSGTDHMAVGWQLPGGALERPIAGNRLIPYSAIPSTGSDPGSPTATGTIEVELWTGITGKEISSIPVNTSPDATSEITIFETEKSIGDNYGSRVRGYLHAPTTGDYTFWIASDDRGELWLSSDENPENKVKIADVSGWTYSRQWDKFTNQMSAPVRLVGGRRYYVEALLKEASGGDHLAVGWQLPNGTLERPIPGSRLSKFETSVDATAARQAGTSIGERLYAKIDVYPNPIEGTDARLTVSGYEGTTQTIQTQLEIINMTGEIVFTERISCGGSDCSEYLLKINEHLVPGVYLINLKTNGERYTKRLFVK